MSTLTFKDFIEHLAAWHRHSLLPPKLARIIALTAGAILPLAFAPFSFPLLAIISVAAILFVWQHIAKPYNAFVYGWLFGLTYFGVGISWVYISLHRYGNMPFLLAALVTFLLICTLALFPAFAGYSWRRLYPRGRWQSLLIAFPAVWVLCEWLRTWVLGGFPWLFVGYSQIDSPLSNVAPIFGVYGASFVVAFVAAVSVAIPRAKNTLTRTALAIALAVTWIGCDLLENVSWTKPYGPPLSVSAVQGNIPQEMKWQNEKINYILQTYENLTKPVWNSSIIVWPEAAIPVLQTQAVRFLEKLDKQAQLSNSTLITGIPIVYAHQGASLFYNAIITLGHTETQYFKRHLVPFGEYTPLKPLLGWMLNFLKIPMSDFTAGAATQQALHAGNILIAPFICYEVAYPELALDFMPNANLLLTVSDDSWFGKSLAAYQHFEMARMRSLETGRYQIVATNTGVTGIINPESLIVALAPTSQSFVLNAIVHPMQGSTPWVAFGHHLWIVLMLICLLVGGPRLTNLERR